MKPEKKVVVIAGNIGVGKSSLTERLSAALGWEPFYEAVDENPYLADFYADMPRWGFHSQVFFLSRRLRHHRQLLDWLGSAVQDRSIYEDAEIFALNLYRQGKMEARDYATYRTLYEEVCSFLPPPHLLVYLRASVPTLLERIALRGRAFEQNIAPDYLARLNDLYEGWIAGWAACPVLIMPTDGVDFVSNSDDLAGIIEQIRGRLQIPQEQP